MKELGHEETRVEGKWIFNGESIQADDACKRIAWLTNDKLSLVAINQNSWESLYQDPRDGRYWLLSYPQSHLQGGGPPSMNLISKQQAQAKFSL